MAIANGQRALLFHLSVMLKQTTARCEHLRKYPGNKAPLTVGTSDLLPFDKHVGVFDSLLRWLPQVKKAMYPVVVGGKP